MGAGYVTNQSTTLVIGSLTSLTLSLSLNIDTRVSSPFSFSSTPRPMPYFRQCNIPLPNLSLTLSRNLPSSIILRKGKRETEEKTHFLNHPWLHRISSRPPLLLLHSCGTEPRFLRAQNSAERRRGGSMEEEIGNNGAS